MDVVAVGGAREFLDTSTMVWETEIRVETFTTRCRSLSSSHSLHSPNVKLEQYSEHRT